MIVLLLYHVKIISGFALYVEGGKGIHIMINLYFDVNDVFWVFLQNIEH
jgi:hypothetical protein